MRTKRGVGRLAASLAKLHQLGQHRLGRRGAVERRGSPRLFSSSSSSL